MSVFKMAQNEADPSEINYNDNDDDDYDDEPKKKLSAKGLLIIAGIICIILLVLAIAGWIFGISKNNGKMNINCADLIYGNSLESADI